jgi:hypothetical protein
LCFFVPWWFSFHHKDAKDTKVHKVPARTPAVQDVTAPA